jgi:hypothetical protein
MICGTAEHDSAHYQLIVAVSTHLYHSVCRLKTYAHTTALAGRMSGLVQPQTQFYPPIPISNLNSIASAKRSTRLTATVRVRSAEACGQLAENGIHTVKIEYQGVTCFYRW